jgi:hypothetical protein
MKPSIASSSLSLGLLASVLFVGAGCKERTTTSASQPSESTADYATKAASSAANTVSSAANTASSAANESWQATKTSAQSAAASVSTAVTEAWERSKDATYAQRGTVIETMKMADASLESQIAVWSAKSESVAESARPAVAAARKEVTDAREVLREKINALELATEGTWPTAKADLNAAWQRMTTAVSALSAKIQS